MTLQAPAPPVTGNYPIVVQHALDPKEPRGFFSFGKRSRGPNEVPRPNGHQVLVYRVNGQHITDNGSFKLDDDRVVGATFVSLVDVRRDAQVQVRLMIPSRDDSEFALQVAFACTVTDPVTVVCDGIVDVTPILSGYLRSQSKLLELGLDYDLNLLNELRRQMTAHVRASVAVRPLIVPGMKVGLAGVEMLTPEELKKLGQGLRTNAFDDRLTSERMQLEHERERLRINFEHEKARLDREHQQALEAERRRFELELRKSNDLPAPSTKDALYMALANGSLTASQYQEKLTELEEREFTRIQLAQQDEAAWQREKEKMELLARLKLLELSEKREAQEAQWTRDDRLRAEQYAREDHIRELDLKLNVLREFAKRGHIDLVNVNVDKLVSELVPTAAEVGGDQPALAAQGEQNPLAKGDDPDEPEMEAEVRDEDVD